MFIFHQHIIICIYQMIWQTAVLSTLTTVSTSSAISLTHIALTAITHTQSTVYKSFQLNIRLRRNFRNLFQRKLPSHHHARKTNILQKANFFYCAVIGLRTCMKCYWRQIQFQNAHILNNQSIGSCIIDLPNQLFSIW